MHFADLKVDFLFRKVFGQRPHLTKALLNDLLDLQGERRIEELVIAPADRVPVVQGAKLSILDVKCREHSGRRFIVEMQILPVSGFLNRVVYNACKTYGGQLRVGRPYTELADVIALSICDFEIWPDPTSQQGGTTIHMVSKWRMTEEASGYKDLLQVQYVFLELPKMPLRGPVTTVAEFWAWLFRVGAVDGGIPANATPEQKEVLALANHDTFTPDEKDAYQRSIDERRAGKTACSRCGGQRRGTW